VAISGSRFTKDRGLLLFDFEEERSEDSYSPNEEWHEVVVHRVGDTFQHQIKYTADLVAAVSFTKVNPSA
jgi:hypothetical protein